jgi:hypothetical protein
MILHDPSFKDLIIAITLASKVVPGVGAVNRLIGDIIELHDGRHVIGNAVVTWDEPDETGMTPVCVTTVR